MNRMILTRWTGTPTLRADVSSPPVAKIQLPKRVLSKTQVARAVSATHQTIDTGRPSMMGRPFVFVPIQP